MRDKSKKKIYSKDLGINLKSEKEQELFKWFLACLLFGKPIQQEVAKRTYFEFVKEGLIKPEAILKAGWDRLVKVLDQGHYVRYDFSTATKLQEICQKLKKDYGTVSHLLKSAKTQKDLEKNLLEFKGVGPVTVGIFLRDLKLFKD
jgi:endonuclease III